jgi:hypothetical protein
MLKSTKATNMELLRNKPAQGANAFYTIRV